MSLIQVNGLDLHVERRGLGEPIVLLHGFTGSAVSWQRVIDRIGQEHQTIAVDLIGHGASAAPRDATRYAFNAALDNLADLAGHLGIHHATWLGYSMGGRLALGLALKHPRLVSLLILESATPGIADETERRSRGKSDKALADRIETFGIETFVTEWERLPLWQSQRGLPEPVLNRQRGIRLANSPVGLANSLRGMGQGVQPSLWNQLGEIAAPTLVIAGELDHKYAELAAKMQIAIPKATLVVAPSAGHAVHLEQPDFFVERVVQFLAAGNPTVREEAISWT